jgi:hypothetical protein
LVACRGVVSEHIDQINTIFAAVDAIDTCPNPVYANDTLFFLKRNFVVIMYNRRALISRMFFLNVDRVHEYRKRLLTPHFCL